jgi:lipoate-protein ligase B
MNAQTNNSEPVFRPSVLAADSSDGVAGGKPIPWMVVDLGVLDYRRVWQLQADLVAAHHGGRQHEDCVLLVEHPSVFTLGRRGGLENLLVERSTLDKAGIEVVAVERGGNITYHGPGQLVVYPIIDIQRAGLSVVDYVGALEEVMIRTAGRWGVVAERNPVNRGVWVGAKKLGSIGIAIRRGISFHGLALNVSLDLRPFGWIQPCGLEGVAMTSLAQELDNPPAMHEVKHEICLHLQAVFGTELRRHATCDLRRLTTRFGPSD